MILLKACPRCHGDMMLEELPGDAEFVCLQCGHRSAAIATPKPVLVPVPVRIRDAA
jgi:hypothetical protein